MLWYYDSVPTENIYCDKSQRRKRPLEAIKKKSGGKRTINRTMGMTPDGAIEQKGVVFFWCVVRRWVWHEIVEKWGTISSLITKWRKPKIPLVAGFTWNPGCGRKTANFRNFVCSSRRRPFRNQLIMFVNNKVSYYYYLLRKSFSSV